MMTFLNLFDLDTSRNYTYFYRVCCSTFRYSTENGITQKIQVLTSRTLENIRRKYSIGGKTSIPDCVALNDWVLENQDLVVSFKQQGEEHEVLELNEFFLAIQNKHQKVRSDTFLI